MLNRKKIKDKSSKDSNEAKEELEEESVYIITINNK